MIGSFGSRSPAMTGTQTLWRQSYTAILSAIFSDELLIKEPRRPKFLLRADLDAFVCAKVRGHDAPKVEISTDFTVEVENDLRTLSTTVHSYLVFGGACS